MAALSSARFIEYVDKLTATFLAFKGTEVSGFGAGDATEDLADDWGLSAGLRQAEAVVLAWADGDLSRGLLPSLKDAYAKGDSNTLGNLVFAGLLQRFSQVCRDAAIVGVSSIDLFASYYNYGAGGPFAALLPPDFRTLHYLTLLSYPDARNVYSPAITNMGQRTVAGGYVDGDEVETASYAGAARLQSTTSGWSGTSGTLSVAVSGYNASGVIATDTWTATIAGSGTVVLTPGSIVKIVTDVTGITLPGGMAAGTVIIAGLLPSSRVNPPVLA